MIDDLQQAMDDGLARSVFYRTLTLAFHPPTDESIALLTSDETKTTLVAAAERLDAARAQAEPLLPVVRELAKFPFVTANDLVGRYHRLFGHTARGVVSACETEYGSEAAFHQPQQLADICGYYLAFGLQPRPEMYERVDHVACECEFMDFLCRKEAFILARLARAGQADQKVCAAADSDENSGSAGLQACPGGWGDSSNNLERDALQETLDETRKAQRSFLRHHLGRFGRAFAGQLMREEEEHFYGRLGRVLFRVLGVECERLRVEAGPATLHLRPEAPDQAPMMCGTGQELIQIQRRGDAEKEMLRTENQELSTTRVSSLERDDRQL